MKLRRAAGDMGTKVDRRIGRILRRSIIAALLISNAASGQSTWRRTYGGGGSDRGGAVCSTADGGFAVAGATGSFGQGGDGYVLRLDPEGDIVWSVYAGGEGAQRFDAIIELSDGGFVAVGTTQGSGQTGYDGYAIRLSELGVILWERAIGSDDWDFLKDVVEVEGGLVMVGDTYADTNGDSDIWLVRIDAGGEVQWERRHGGVFADEGNAIATDTDGALIVAGAIGTTDGTSDAILVKWDEAGVFEWDASISTDSSDSASDVIIAEDGTFIIAGTTKGFSQFSEMLVARVLVDGQPDWLSHTGQLDDWEAFGLVERPTGGFAVTGYTRAFGLGGKDMYLLLTTSDGSYDFGTTFGGGSDEEAFDLDLTDDGGYVAAGYSDSYGPGPRSVFVVRTGPNGLTNNQTVVQSFDTVDIPELPDSDVRASPNPVSAGGILRISTPEGANPISADLFRSDGLLTASLHRVGDGQWLLPEEATGLHLLKLRLEGGGSISLPLVIVAD